VLFIKSHKNISKRKQKYLQHFLCLFQPFQAVGGSLSSAASHAGALASAVGQAVVSVGTRTCALRRGRHVDPEDRPAATGAVNAGAAERLEHEMDEVVAVPSHVRPAEEEETGDGGTTPVPEVVQDPEPSVIEVEPEPPGEVIAVVVTLDDSIASDAPSSSLDSFKSAPSSLASTASISTLRRALPSRMFLTRSGEEGDDEETSDSSSTSSDVTVGN
jgi:hypothetical protein